VVLPKEITVPFRSEDIPFIDAGTVPTTSGGTLRAGYARISTKGGVFSAVNTDTEINAREIHVIIVGANPKLSKTWYAKEWSDDDKPSAPDCFSLDGVTPDLSIEVPQHHICVTCPQNAWGSRITDKGQQVKACSDQKRLAVVMHDNPSGEVLLLQVTPGSLKGLNQYQKQLSVRGIPPEIVKTKISLDPSSEYPKLVFTFAGFLDEETQSIVDDLFGSALVRHITGEKQPIKQGLKNE